MVSYNEHWLDNNKFAYVHLDNTLLKAQHTSFDSLKLVDILIK